jgi:RNA polymerase sigma factor for flagellar operon FliA
LAQQLPQVRYIARRIHERLPRHVPLEDLVHAGVVGLMDALDKFDLGKKVQFGSYAKFRIRGAILDSLRELDWGPRELRRQARAIEDAHLRLRFRLGRQPSEPELARELGLPLEELQKLIGNISALEIGSLRLISPQDGREEDLAERMSADRDDTPLTQYLNSEMKEIVKTAIQDLPEREREVLSLYYFQELTMKEIGALMGVGESRVSQIHSMAVSRLRAVIAGLAGRGEAPARRAAAAASM